MAVPALHQVDEVQHDDEGHGDVDVAVITGRGVRRLRDGHLVEVDDHPGDHGEPAPGDGPQTTRDERAQDEAFPVGVPAQGPAERLLDRPLLQGEKSRSLLKRTDVTLQSNC